MTPIAQYKEYIKRGRKGRLCSWTSSQNMTRGMERAKYNFSPALGEAVRDSDMTKR